MTTKWNGWFGLGGQIRGVPAVVNPTADTIDIYVRGTDNRLWQKWWDGKKWHPSDTDWVMHDDGSFRLGSSPAVVANGANFRDVYARGQDGVVYHKFWDGKKWNGWFGLGGQIKDAPAVVKPTSGTIDIYVRGTDDRLWQKWWDGKKWHPSDTDWHLHNDGGFRLGSAPAVVSNGANFRDVYVRGQDGAVYRKFWDGKKWNGWFGLGGQIIGAPSVTKVNSSITDIYAHGMGDRLWQKAWDGKKWIPSDSGWMMHNDGNFRLSAAPAVVSQGDKFRDVYGRGASGDVCHKFWDNKLRSNPITIRSDATKSATIDNLVSAMVGTNGPGTAIAVLKHGVIVHLAGYGLANPKTKTPITSETMFHMASTGKQFTGLGIMMLAEQGKLDYDAPLTKYIPKFSNIIHFISDLKSFSPEVTIRRLLHHTSGVEDYYSGDAQEALSQISSNPTNADVIKHYIKRKFPMTGTPGDQYVYSNSEYDLLGSVIEHVSGQSYVDFFKTRVFLAAGMTDTFSFPDTSRMKDANIAVGHDFDANGALTAQNGSNLDNLVGAGSFYSSVYDLCAYDEALANNSLVSSTSLKLAYTSGTTNDKKDTGYGFGWEMDSNGDYAQHGGAWTGFYSTIRRYINTRFSVYILCNRDGLDMNTMVKTIVDVYK